MVGISLREKGTIVMNISKLFFHALSNNCSLSSFAACGGVFNFSTGVIKSPAYSYSDYPNNIQCSYTIVGRDDRVLQLKYVRQVLQSLRLYLQKGYSFAVKNTDSRRGYTREPRGRESEVLVW